MDQQTSLDVHTLIKEDLKESPYLRIYSQQQIFSIRNQQLDKSVQLPFNQIFNQTFNQLNIMNRLIASNSRLTSNFLQNGKEIFSKKQIYFQNFLKMYPLINDVLMCLSPQQYWTSVYSIMTISNLILKLSINMAKISIISVNKLLSPAYFNIFMVSILFEKFLQLNLLISKEKMAQKQKDPFYITKLFPKITIVKFSKIKNPYDIKYIQKSQNLFHQNAANIQFIQLFQEDSYNYKQKHDYSQYQSINLSQQLGLKAPFSFELYLFISDIIISKMVDYRPDIILYIEDYSSDCVVIQPKIRGLIINQFSQKVQNKILILKEFGITNDMKIQKMNQLNLSNLEQKSDYQRAYSTTCHKISQTMIDMKNILSLQDIQYYSVIRQQNKAKSIQNSLIHKYVNNYLIEQNKKLYKSIQLQILTQQKIKTDTPFMNKIRLIRKILLDQLTCIALALTQKSSFDDVVSQFRDYKFSPHFLINFKDWIQKQKRYCKEKGKYHTQMYLVLSKKHQKIKGMLDLADFNTQISQTRYGFPFYNLMTNKMENLVQIKNKQLKSIRIQKQDEFYVCYQHQYIIIFVFRQSSYNVYVRHNSNTYFNCQIEQKYDNNNFYLSRKNSTLIANQKYLYKAFGQYKDDSLNIDSCIYRINIQKPQQIENSQWKCLGNTCFVYGKSKTFTNGVRVPLQFKRYGYGYSYNTNDEKKSVNIVIFGGGYNYKTQNQQRINKCFYVIKDHREDIVKIGKSNNNLINQSQNLKNKVIIYPFVYGIPLQYEEDKQFAILNTNGILCNTNNFKKLFLSRVRINQFSSPLDIGIIAQNKLLFDKQSSQISIANKNKIINHLIGNYNKINRLNQRIAFYTQNQTILVLRLQKDKYKNIDSFNLDYQQANKDQNIEINFSSNILAPMIPNLKK